MSQFTIKVQVQLDKSNSGVLGGPAELRVPSLVRPVDTGAFNPVMILDDLCSGCTYFLRVRETVLCLHKIANKNLFTLALEFLAAYQRFELDLQKSS